MKSATSYYQESFKSLKNGLGKFVLGLVSVYLLVSPIVIAYELAIVEGKGNPSLILIALCLYLVGMFFLSPFYLYGPYAMANELVKTGQTKVSTVFEAKNNYLKILGTLFLKGLYTLGWTLLLIVPGMIKSFSYSMTYFIIRENPEMGSDEAIEKSMKMMDGHKGELFVTLLLYGLLFLVVYIIFMVLMFVFACINQVLVVIPVILMLLSIVVMMSVLYTVMAHFYDDLKAQENPSQVELE